MGKSAAGGVFFCERTLGTLGRLGFVDERVTPELLGSLLDEHGGALALYAAQWTENADDCVQEALIELAGQSHVPASPVAWLYRVVRNRAISQYRSSRRRERREQLALRLRPREGVPPGQTAESDSEQLAAAVQ